MISPHLRKVTLNVRFFHNGVGIKNPTEILLLQQMRYGPIVAEVSIVGTCLTGTEAMEAKLGKYLV